MGIDVTPQYLVESKKPVEAGAPPQFKKQNRPNTTESFKDYQVSVRIIDIYILYKEWITQYPKNEILLLF